MKVKFGPWGVSILAAAVVAVPAMGAFAAVVVPAGTRVGSLIEVGPIAAENGFPTWYRDSNGATPSATSRLEMCLPKGAVADPYCAAPALPNKQPMPLPLVYPTNYPDEIFYQLATTTVVAPGINLLVEMNVEGAYATGPVIAGDEMVFGRIRIRDTKTGLTPGTIYRVTHPYGIDDITVDDKGDINMTQDVGAAAGAFGNVLGGRVGPFLKWDATAPIAPVGYTGDPAIDHTVVGSPYGTNFVKVEKKVGATWTPVAQKNVFSVQGRYATNSGVDVARATYTAPAAGPASIDVFATSEVDQSIQVGANVPLGLATTTLRGEQGRYFGRLPLAAAPPVGATIDVINAGDKPVATKNVKLTDLVTIASAVYTAGADATVPGSLVVTATSSDEVSVPAPVLSVTGFGVPATTTGAGTALAPAVMTFPVTAPPSMVTVTSSRLGSATIATTAAAAVLDPTLPIAAFTAPLTVVLGQPVLLDAAPSTGGPLTYLWSQVSGPAIPTTVMTTPTLSFTPTVVGPVVMQLVVTGPAPLSPVSVPTTRTITVTPPLPALTAVAGPDQVEKRGDIVTLNGSASLGAQSLAWVQTGGPAVTLSSATAAKPTFVYSVMPLPKAAVGVVNTGYVANNLPLQFTLTVTGVNGATATDTVAVAPLPEAFTGVVARYRINKGDWRVTGLSSISAGQRVTVVLGPLATGKTIGSATVSPTGTFAVAAGSLPDPRVPAPAETKVTILSATGGVATVGMIITP
jgi:hypothetical protein